MYIQAFSRCETIGLDKKTVCAFTETVSFQMFVQVELHYSTCVEQEFFVGRSVLFGPFSLFDLTQHQCFDLV